MNEEQRKDLRRIIIAAVLVILIAAGEMIIGKTVDIPWFVWAGFYLVTYLYIGREVLEEALEGIKEGEVFDEDFLMAVATIGAFALGDYREAVSVMIFFSIGELFESYAVGKSRKNISELMDIRPDYANMYVYDKLTQVNPNEVPIGSIIVVQPGEKVPIDGIVTEGNASLDTAALTGESEIRKVGKGDEVISGCISLEGTLKIETTKDFGESTVSKILELVENAGSRKSKQENFITKFARYYTPAVCYSALALAIIPPLISILCLNQASCFALWSDWIERALTFLVISCPCALVISIPLTFFAGIGGASREGILVKGSNYLEGLSKVSCVAFDKTGTLTNGKVVDGKVTSDTVKPHSKEAVAALKASGIRKTVMLTGDRREVAERIGKELEIDDVRSQLLPGDKVACLEELLAQSREKELVAFVGDGINDAPVLSRADIGIAMGALGSDAAIEAADVVLMDDDPLTIAKAIRISKKCLRIVRQNITLAISVKAVCLILGALGIANMWLAIFADVGIMVIAVLNAVRALRAK